MKINSLLICAFAASTLAFPAIHKDPKPALTKPAETKEPKSLPMDSNLPAFSEDDPNFAGHGEEGRGMASHGKGRSKREAAFVKPALKESLKTKPVETVHAVSAEDKAFAGEGEEGGGLASHGKGPAKREAEAEAEAEADPRFRQERYWPGRWLK